MEQFPNAFNMENPGGYYYPPPDVNYPPPLYPQQPYPPPLYPQQPYLQPTYPQPTYPQPLYPQPPYPQPTYPQVPYLQPPYPQVPYLQPTAPQPTYPQPTYPQPTAPQPTAPQPPKVPSTPNKTWLNLNGKPFTDNPNMWYNLQTNRSVKNQPKGIEFSLRGIRVLGTEAQITHFWTNNLNSLDTIYPSGTKIEDVMFKPFLDITFLSEDVTRRSGICYLGTAGTIIPAAQVTDVEQLTPNEVSNLCTFSFAGLFVKCRVTEVIDGDTIHAVIFVPVHELGAARAVGPQGAPRVGILPEQNMLIQRSGFFASVKIRMYGYDAQEKDTPEGKIAKQLMIDKFHSINNIIWCQFVEMNIAQEKYDRILGVLYEDQNKTLLLNDYLLKQEQILNKRLVNPYIGGTKLDFD